MDYTTKQMFIVWRCVYIE